MEVHVYIIQINMSVIKQNFSNFKKSFKKPKIHDFGVCKFLQLKYTFIPIALLVIYLFFNVDTPVENYIKHDMPNYIPPYFEIITRFGLALYLLIPLVIIVIARLFIDGDKLSEKPRNLFNCVTSYSWFLIATVAISGIVGQILKFIIGRARPKFFLEYGSHYFQHFHKPGYDFASMPSGHSITIAAFSLGLLYLFPKLRVFWVFCALLVAFSRVVLGSHYPSDVVFGLSVGFYTTIFIYYWMKNRELI
ncbi:phosphatase PAP2 family protein [Francisella sp. Scap27]|nr:phosphatase PAP2 family protein [Francisella sp. Scap27]